MRLFEKWQGRASPGKKETLGCSGSLSERDVCMDLIGCTKSGDWLTAMLDVLKDATDSGLAVIFRERDRKVAGFAGSPEEIGEAEEILSRLSLNELKRKGNHTKMRLNRVTLKDEMLMFEVIPLCESGYGLVLLRRDFLDEDFDYLAIGAFMGFAMRMHDLQNSGRERDGPYGMRSRDEFFAEARKIPSDGTETVWLVMKAAPQEERMDEILEKTAEKAEREAYYTGNGMGIILFREPLFEVHRKMNSHVEDLAYGEGYLFGALLYRYRSGSVAENLYYLENHAWGLSGGLSVMEGTAGGKNDETKRWGKEETEDVSYREI